jgi:predicted O-methyltransferase YrrM
MKSKYDLIKYFGNLGFTTGAEIGVAQGYFSEAMCKAIPNLKLYCIDVWRPYRGNQWSKSMEKNMIAFETARTRLSRYDVTFIREMSMDAAKKFKDGSLDFAFIDANHAFDYVMEDLIEWSKKVRVGGILSGDDYYHFRKAGVIEAVDAYTKAHGIKFNLTDPYTDKIRDRDGYEQACYWWIKT